MTKRYDHAFADGLSLYTRTYSRMRAADGDTMSIEEIIGGLVSVIATAIEQVESVEYRRRLVEATHRALDERMAMPFVPTSSAIN